MFLSENGLHILFGVIHTNLAKIGVSGSSSDRAESKDQIGTTCLFFLFGGGGLFFFLNQDWGLPVLSRLSLRDPPTLASHSTGIAA